MTIVVRSPGAMKRVPGLVQSIVTEIDRNQPVYDVASLQSRIDASLSTRRFVAFLLASFSVLGIVITAIGLYGTLSYSVLVRGREFGIRSALGATPRDLAVLVFRSGMHLVFAGIVCGGAAAIFAARYLSSEFYGIQLADPMTWSWVGVALFATGVIACLIPSWRASCTDTASKLKEE
jgi:putative ABC transport system permease protein